MHLTNSDASNKLLYRFSQVVTSHSVGARRILETVLYQTPRPNPARTKLVEFRFENFPVSLFKKRTD